MMEISKETYGNHEDIDSIFYDVENNKVSVMLLRDDNNFPQQKLEISLNDNLNYDYKLIKNAIIEGKSNQTINNSEEIESMMQELDIVGLFERNINKLLTDKNSEIYLAVNDFNKDNVLSAKVFISRENDTLNLNIEKNDYADENSRVNVTRMVVIRSNGEGHLTDGAAAYFEDQEPVCFNEKTMGQYLDSSGLNIEEYISNLREYTPDNGLGSYLKNMVNNISKRKLK